MAITAVGSNKTGHSGADIVLPVPPGTVMRNTDTGEIIGEVLEDGDRIRRRARAAAAERATRCFATSVHAVPREWQPGEDGEMSTLELELKLIADVGLVGQPNAGKSTLLSVICAARPKIADYPFTTLAPNLGVVQMSDSRTFVVADIPGIIEGAHEGKGLGLQFLRHIERTRLLAFLIPIDAMDWQAEYDQLRREIAQYSGELARKAALRRLHQDGSARRRRTRRRSRRRMRSASSRFGGGAARDWRSSSSRGGAGCSRCGRPTCSRSQDVVLP